MIPKIIHQTWKNSEIPEQWQAYAKKVQDLNPDWKYRLWTDEDNDAFVKENYPKLYPIFKNFPRGIMRADVIRYLIMDKIGGVYLDLDYEMLVPFDFKNHPLVLPKNRSLEFGDEYDGIGNCIFASAPNQQFWKDVINSLIENPPQVEKYIEVLDATGPEFLNSIFYKNEYPTAHTPERLIYHPPSPRSRSDYRKILKNGTSIGVHHLWGSWREKSFLSRWKKKFLRKVGLK